MRRVLALVLVLAPLAARGQDACHTASGPSAGGDLILGTIDVRTSATGEAAREIETGMLALHSFWYEEARDHFQAAERLDPGAALAYWGEAASHDHPLWGQHDSTAARAVLSRADSLRSAGALRASPREAAFLDALGVLVRPGRSLLTRRDHYAAAMAALAASTRPTTRRPCWPRWRRCRACLSSATRRRASSLSRPRSKTSTAAIRRTRARSTTSSTSTTRPSSPRSGCASRATTPRLRRPRRTRSTCRATSSASWACGPRWRPRTGPRGHASVAWQERTHRPLATRDYHALAWLHDALLAQGRFADAAQVRAVAEADAALAAARHEAPGAPAATARALPAAFLDAAATAGLPLAPEPVTADPDSLPPYALYPLTVRAIYAGQDAVADRALARLRAFAASPTPPGSPRTCSRASRGPRRGGCSARATWPAPRRVREAIRIDSTANPSNPPVGETYALLADLRLAAGAAATALAMVRAMDAVYPHHAETELRLARAAAAAGDAAAARDAYARLLTTWAHADPDLPALAEARAALGGKRDESDLAGRRLAGPR